MAVSKVIHLHKNYSSFSNNNITQFKSKQGPQGSQKLSSLKSLKIQHQPPLKTRVCARNGFLVTRTFKSSTNNGDMDERAKRPISEFVCYIMQLEKRWASQNSKKVQFL